MDVVDIDVDPLADRARRRRTLARIGLPLGGVGLIVGFLLGITVYADSANRAGVLGLSDTLLHGLQERIALQVSAYLEPAAHATLLAHSMLGRGGATVRAEDAYAFAASVLAETPQVANVLFADDAGNFMLVRRAIGGPAGATDTKRILVGPAGRSVEWITRDAAGAVTARRLDPSDPYDARTRGWFTGARGVDEVFWTGVYVFFSERAPGVTAAVHGPDAKPDVVGIDIKLDAISKFLAGLSIGRTGRAYIVSGGREMVAGPDPSRILREEGGSLVPAKVEEVGDAALAGSWDHYRVEGPGTRVIEVGGERLISIVTPLAARGQNWLLVITVPEAEFSGFVGVNSRRAGLLSLVVVALALGLAVLLVRQGLRADRADRAVAERSAAVRQQSAAFARLATEAGGFGPDGSPPKALTETLAEATGARRAGIWRLLAGGQVLRCEDSFEPASGGHVAGVEITRQEVPGLIDALSRGEEIDAPDARTDRRTGRFHGLLMAPLGSTRLAMVPVMRRSAAGVAGQVAAGQDAAGQDAAGWGEPLGVVLLEDARRDPAARDIARACATMIALQAPVQSAAGPAPLPSVAPAAGVAEAAADALGLDPALARAEGGVVCAAPRAAVLVLRLPELAIAGEGGVSGDAESAGSLAHRIACAAQRIAAAHGIPYLKMLGITVVAAAGHTAQGLERDAAQRIADAAVALREMCAELFDAGDEPADFSLGLDTGTVLGGAMGTAPGLFNLWGEPFRGADGLARSAASGTIQVSEQSYALLRQAFLFRPRGLFHRPGVGEARTYVLAGRA
jgi:adenylate cyclase